MAVAIREVAPDPDAPLRRLVGSDADLIGGLRRDLGDDELERRIRTAPDFWDGEKRR